MAAQWVRSKSMTRVIFTVWLTTRGLKVRNQEHHCDLPMVGSIGRDISACLVIGRLQTLAAKVCETGRSLVFEHSSDIVEERLERLHVRVSNVKIDITDAIQQQLVEMLLEISPVKAGADERLIDG